MHSDNASKYSQMARCIHDYELCTMNYELTPSLLSWPLFCKPERLQVMLAILLSREEDGSINPLALEQLPMLTGLSTVTVQRSIQELVDARVFTCVSSVDCPRQLIVTGLPDGIQNPSYLQTPSSPPLGGSEMGTAVELADISASQYNAENSESALDNSNRLPLKVDGRGSSRFVKPSLSDLTSYTENITHCFNLPETRP